MMPYKSAAQSRYMHMKHPEIASRWDSEMRHGKKGYARRHPIKAAGLPDHVDKGLMARILRKAPKEAGPVIRTGVTRASTVGVEYVHQGVKGWGPSESAARAAWQNNRAMSKSDWEVPMDHFEPPLPRRRPNYGSGNTVGKRMTNGASTGVAKPKKVGPTRVAARRANGMLPIGVPPIPPGDVGKRDRSYNPEANRQRRLGVAAAAAVGGGGLLAHRGIRGVRAATNLARHDAAYDEGMLGYLHEGKTHIRSPKRDPKTNAIISEPGHDVTRGESLALHRLGQRPHGMLAKPTRRQAAQIGGGASLSAAGAAGANHGRSRANREWR